MSVGEMLFGTTMATFILAIIIDNVVVKRLTRDLFGRALFATFAAVAVGIGAYALQVANGANWNLTNALIASILGGIIALVVRYIQLRGQNVERQS
jgi:uncharacterized membrane-anchored protein